MGQLRQQRFEPLAGLGQVAQAPQGFALVEGADPGQRRFPHRPVERAGLLPAAQGLQGLPLIEGEACLGVEHLSAGAVAVARGAAAEGRTGAEQPQAVADRLLGGDRLAQFVQGQRQVAEGHRLMDRVVGGAVASGRLLPEIPGLAVEAGGIGLPRALVQGGGCRDGRGGSRGGPADRQGLQRQKQTQHRGQQDPQKAGRAAHQRFRGREAGAAG